MISPEIEAALTDHFLFENAVCHVYNNRSFLWKLRNKQIDAVHVYTIMHGDKPEGVNVGEVIAIAKAVCSVMGTVCPIINGL